MKKAIFILSYLLIPAIPVFIYLNNLKPALNSYAISVSLGIAAFIFICNQFILASRPGFLVKSFTLKGILAFHQTMPIVILAMAAVHKALKESNGFSDDSFQAALGAVAWWAFAAAVIFTVMLMANTFWLKLDILKRLKTWVYKTFSLTYKKTRIAHNATVAAGILLLFHVLLASSSSFKSNPAGISFMVFWLLFSLFLYGRYKIKGIASARKETK